MRILGMRKYARVTVWAYVEVIRLRKREPIRQPDLRCPARAYGQIVHPSLADIFGVLSEGYNLLVSIPVFIRLRGRGAVWGLLP